MGGTLDIGSEGKGELRGSWFRNGWTGKGAMNVFLGFRLLWILYRLYRTRYR